MLKKIINFFHLLFQYILPQKLFTRFVAAVVQCRFKWWRKIFLAWYIRHYQVDMSLVVEEDPMVYADFNNFFTRELKPEVRPIASGVGEIVCPCDGGVSQIGEIKQDRVFQAKGHDYSLQDLLGGDQQLAAQFENGNYATLYLSPKDYHRVHMPCDGKLEQMIYVPGRLFSVNPFTVAKVPALFARNERVISIFKAEQGPMAVILVGAIIVGSIETIWQGQITPPHEHSTQHWDYSESQIELKRGDEMGRFKLGSTVILLFPSNTMSWRENIEPNMSVVMGQLLGNGLMGEA